MVEEGCSLLTSSDRGGREGEGGRDREPGGLIWAGRLDSGQTLLPTRPNLPRSFLSPLLDLTFLTLRGGGESVAAAAAGSSDSSRLWFNQGKEFLVQSEEEKFRKGEDCAGGIGTGGSFKKSQTKLKGGQSGKHPPSLLVPSRIQRSLAGGLGSRSIFLEWFSTQCHRDLLLVEPEIGSDKWACEQKVGRVALCKV